MLGPAALSSQPPAGPEPAVAAGASRTERPPPRPIRQKQMTAAPGWWPDRMVADLTASEKLTIFWHGHGATSAEKAGHI